MMTTSSTTTTSEGRQGGLLVLDCNGLGGAGGVCSLWRSREEDADLLHEEGQGEQEIRDDSRQSDGEPTGL